nr:reverse transcriptase domain-containing protein [Tanacetum cinerariifolium]
MKFGLKNDMIQQVYNSCQFHGLPSNNANKHLDKFLHVTQSIKVNGVIDDALRLYLFPHSLTHHATDWFDRLQRNSINTFEQMAKIFLEKYFPPSMVTKLRNEINNFRQRPDESLFEAWELYKLSINRCHNHNMLPVTEIYTFYNDLTLRHRDTINAAAGGTFMKRHPEECYDLIENMTTHHNDWDTSAQRMNGVIDDALRLYLFPHSLTHHATDWFDRLQRNSINTFEQMAKIFLEKYFPPSMVTKLRNEINNFRQRPDESLFEAWELYKLSINRCHNHNMLPVTEIYTFYNDLTLRHRDTINAAAGGTFMKRHPEECYDLIENMTTHHNDWDTSAQWSKSSSSITSSFNTKIAALKAEMAEINKNLMRVLQVNQQVKAVTPNYETCGGLHSITDCPATVGQNQNIYAAEPIKANDAILKNIQTNMISLKNSNLDLKNMFGQFMKMNTASSSGSRTLPVVERETEATKDTVHPTNNGSTKDVQSLVVQTESPILNSELVVAPIIESVVAPVSAPNPNQRPSIPYPSRFQDQKLRDKANVEREKIFQIFKDLNFNISFADALILMPKFGLSIKSLLTNKDKLCELARTPLNEHCSAVLLKKFPEKLGDPCKFLIPYRSISRPIGVAKDVYVKVGKFHFPADFVVVDFDADPRVPLILGRSILKTKKALIDVFEGELTLREYSQEFLGFSNVIASGNPTPYYDPIVSTTSPTLTPFRESDFLLEEVDAFLALEDDPTSPEVDQSYVDTEGDIIFLEAFINDDPSLPPPNQGNYLPQVRKELKIYEAKSDKSLIDKPPEVKLKDLCKTILTQSLTLHTDQIKNKEED